MLAIPAFRAAAAALSESLRVPPGAPARLVSENDLALPAVESMLHQRHSIVRQVYGWTAEDALMETQQLCTHLAAAANHELAGRKTFWVSADLAEALVQTNLDIPGDVLELPFAACAFVFNDAPTLELARALIHRHATVRALYRTLTVYAFPSHNEAEPGFDFVFLADAYDGEWPYLISRSVLTDGKRNLDEILDSHPDSSTDDLFRDAEMGELLKLVVNAVLYTTSADYRKDWRPPAPPALSPPARSSAATASSTCPAAYRSAPGKPLKRGPGRELARRSSSAFGCAAIGVALIAAGKISAYVGSPPT